MRGARTRRTTRGRDAGRVGSGPGSVSGLPTSHSQAVAGSPHWAGCQGARCWFSVGESPLLCAAQAHSRTGSGSTPCRCRRPACEDGGRGRARRAVASHLRCCDRSAVAMWASAQTPCALEGPSVERRASKRKKKRPRRLTWRLGDHVAAPCFYVPLCGTGPDRRACRVDGGIRGNLGEGWGERVRPDMRWRSAACDSRGRVPPHRLLGSSTDAADVRRALCEVSRKHEGSATATTTPLITRNPFSPRRARTTLPGRTKRENISDWALPKEEGHRPWSGMFLILVRLTSPRVVVLEQL